MASITDEDECKDAAINAGESYKGLSKDYPGFEYYNPQGRLLPTGCFIYGNHGVYFNSNPPCSSFCAGRYFNTKAICKQGISNQFSRLKNDIRIDISKMASTHLISNFISLLDVSCSTWPKPQAQTHGCDGTGTAPLKVLDPLMKSSDSASCERLCARERENGCCYLNTGEGCSWRPGGYSTKRNSDVGISINCNRAGK